jgi:hypothetical protein
MSAIDSDALTASTCRGFLPHQPPIVITDDEDDLVARIDDLAERVDRLIARLDASRVATQPIS